MIALGANPDHGFDEPLGLLSDCHRRIERFLEVLMHVCVARAGEEPRADERAALERATEYFRAAAPRHTQDEEESLFPRLRAARDSQIEDALAQIQRLEADHEAASRKHEEVERLVKRWLDAGRLGRSELADLTRALGELQRLYSAHITIEDRQIFPLAAKVLSSEQIRALGVEMAQRRGLPSSEGESQR